MPRLLISFFAVFLLTQGYAKADGDINVHRFFCGDDSTIVSKKDMGVYTTYTCSDGKTFDHPHKDLI